ncbi:MAG TPA: aminopeptidase N [Streptosporangiaceae bacterium]|jgi:aminopeptidase N|nr:aminopeptidase N [Streptosporangiaceae bacterium]
MPIAEITRHETSRRAELLTVHSYSVELDLTCGEKIFRSTSVIDFDCGEPGAATYADLVAEDVHEITLNGRAIDPAQACSEGRIALTGLAARNELRVVAECAYTADSKGMHRATDSADGRVYCYTNFEPADARRVYANFEQPDLKAAFTFHVIAPAHWTVVSNQPAPEPQDAGDGASVWHFPPTPRISTYLTVVVAGEYHVETDSHTTPGGQVIPLAIACRQSLAGHLEATDMFTVTKQGLDYYTELFDSEYPFAKYDQAFVPEFSAGAMENPGCVTFSERMLFRSKVTDMMYELRAMVILHEMAHMWFGDLVTMKWWDDLWLNESFADYSAALASSEGTRFTDAWTTFSGSRKTWGYMQDQLPTTHPIAADVSTLSEAIANFDGISYAKGASVLKQLAAYLGRDNFFAGIRAYFTEHGYGNATLASLLAALERSSGVSLGDWSKAWLQTAGPNTLRSEFAVGADGRFTTFAVLQEAAPEHPTLRPHHIAVGLYNMTPDGALVRTQQVEVDISGARTEVPALVGLAQPDLILLNDDDLGYAIVRFDHRSLATLTASIGAFSDSLARTVSWSAVLDMVQRAELSVPAFVAILVGGMSKEPAVSVLQILHITAARLMAVAADPRWLPSGKEQLATAALELLPAADPGSDHQLAWIQLLGWTAVTTAQLDFLAGILAGNGVVPGLAVDTELRWALLRRLASMGRADDSDIDAELALDPTDAGRRHAAASRASIPDAEHKAAAWQLMTQSQELGHEGVAAVAVGFGQAEHAELLTPYVDLYFEALPEIWETRGEHLKRLLADGLFPSWAASPELLQRVDDFLAAEARDPSMVRVLVERRDVVDRALQSRALSVK